MKIKKTVAVARKEVYHLIRDFRSLYLAFIIPLLLILLFGYALSLGVKNIPMIVVDHDQTGMSRDLIDRMNALPYFNLLGYARSHREAIRQIDLNTATVGVIIPAGFTRTIQADRNAAIQVIIDGSDPNTAGLTRSYFAGFIAEYNQGRLNAFLNRSGRGSIRAPVEGRIRVWFNEDLESRNFIMPGIIAIIIIIMIVGAMLTSLVVAREHKNGTLETVRSLPISGIEFLLGKAIPYFFIGLVDVLVAVLMCRVIFGVIMKSSLWLMVLAASVYMGVALALGLLISTLTKSQLAANQMAILITYLPSLLLSDFVFPIVNMPPVLQKITFIVPAKYFINILRGVYLRSLNLGELWADYGVLFFMLLILGG